MPSQNNSKQIRSNCVCLFLSGLAIGWLVGLSVSPIIQTVLTSIIAVIVGISSTLAGIKKPSLEDDQTQNKKERLLSEVSPMPTMFLVVGLAIGASVGVYARTNNWLGLSSKNVVEEWAATGLKKEAIASRIFDTLYPPAQVVVTGSHESNDKQNDKKKTMRKDEQGKINKQSSGLAPTVASMPPDNHYSVNIAGVLFSAPSPEECDQLLSLDGDRFKRTLAQTKNEYLTKIAHDCDTNDCMKEGVNKICIKK